MALRKIKNKWYIYYRDIETGKYKTLPTGTSDEVEAKRLDKMFMQSIATARAFDQIVQAMPHHNQIKAKQALLSNDETDGILIQKTKRALLKDAIMFATQRREISASGKKLWKRFLTLCPYHYFDELTPQICIKLLDKTFQNAPKCYNNMLSACNHIIKMCLIDVGLTISPFAAIPRKTVSGKRQRAFTEAEFIKLFKVAQEPMKTAILIGWFTGLRKKDAFSVGWENVINHDVIDTMPFKTQKKGIRVFIPIHPQLLKWVKKWKNQKNSWTTCTEKESNVHGFNSFSTIMQLADISPTEEEDLNFDCLRNSFIDRMANFGISEDVRKQIVGHTETQTHDHYRGFIESARIVQLMPQVKGL